MPLVAVCMLQLLFLVMTVVIHQDLAMIFQTMLDIHAIGMVLFHSQILVVAAIHLVMKVQV